ncbi:hypothetical protein [uncultured Schumannella sp.]|uniref:hypothetical protein n=1 Tax=uncultured Schumannella sp. TaxID=1195956 RepID=UPI0025D72C46|nr:hypothetical protein [uncultured Schumannella sp.]
MSNEVARYRDGYESTHGEMTVLTDRIVAAHGWPSAGDAIATWRARGDFDDATTEKLLNGKRQVVDVRGDSRFHALGVARIWREIVFELRADSATPSGDAAPRLAEH